MVHTLAFWFGALDLSIPHTVTMTGANYLAPKMEIPDTFQVSMSHAEKLFFTFTSMFGNNYYGEGHDYLFGTKATLIHTDSDEVHVLPQGEETPTRPRPSHGGDKEMTGHAHAELLRLRPQPQGAGLSVRTRLPHLDRLPDGDRVLPRGKAPCGGTRRRKRLYDLQVMMRTRRTHARGWEVPRPNHALACVVTSRAFAWPAASSMITSRADKRHSVTTVIRPWFRRDERPPASGVSPIHDSRLCVPMRTWRFPLRTTHSPAVITGHEFGERDSRNCRSVCVPRPGRGRLQWVEGNCPGARYLGLDGGS